VTPDVIVAGGGVIGTAIAHQLARRGARVTVLDHAAPGQATAASAAMIAPDADAVIGPLRELAVESARLYPALCAELLDRTGLDSGLRENALLLVAWSEEDERDLRRRRHRLEQAGVASAWLDPGRLRDVEPALAAGLQGGLHLQGQRQVDAPALLHALSRAAADLGVSFRSEEAHRLVIEGDRVTGVQAGANKLSAGEIVIAAGAWSGSLAADLRQPMPVRPIRGQMVGLSPPTSLLRTMCFSSHVYLLRKAAGWIYVGATEEDVGFDASPTAAGVRDLLSGAVALAPALEQAKLSHVAAGLRPATPDGMPVIGRMPGWSGITIATGHFRDGVLLAPITAELVGDLVEHRRPRLPVDAFDPARFLLRAA